MSEPFVAEIRILPFSFAPQGWAFCNGQILPISQNTALFSLLGTTFGGNGTSNFALPNLQGSAPLHPGQGPGLSNYDLGDTGGAVTVTLLGTQLPSHVHAVSCTTSGGTSNAPQNDIWAEGGAVRGEKLYTAQTGSNVNMNGQAYALAGGGGAHNNMPPYLVMNFCIALQGIFPARN